MIESRPHACGADDIAASLDSTAIHTPSALNLLVHITLAQDPAFPLWMMSSIHSRIDVPVRGWVSLAER